MLVQFRDEGLERESWVASVRPSLPSCPGRVAVRAMSPALVVSGFWLPWVQQEVGAWEEVSSGFTSWDPPCSHAGLATSLCPCRSTQQSSLGPWEGPLSSLLQAEGSTGPKERSALSPLNYLEWE